MTDAMKQQLSLLFSPFNFEENSQSGLTNFKNSRKDICYETKYDHISLHTRINFTTTIYKSPKNVTAFERLYKGIKNFI